MINIVSSTIREQLISQQESGMGYQLIKLIDWNNLNNNKKGIVYNGKYFIEMDGDFRMNQKQLFNEQNKLNNLNFAPISNKFEIALIISPNELKNDSDKILLSELIPDFNKSKGAKETEELYSADGISKYIRLSAFEDDIRIDKINKRLLPGSFSTTYEDYLLLRDLKIRPNERYALPNDETIKYCFEIQPKTTDTFKQGIVQPANGYKGGGIEVFLKKEHQMVPLLNK